MSVVSQVVAWGVLAYLLGARSIFYGFFDISDTHLYFDYAQRMASGLMPFVQWPVEYPPLALVLFAIPGHLNAIESYQVWFAFEMFVISLVAGACTSLIAAIVQPTGNRPYAVAGLYSFCVLMTGAILANRYDVAVTLVMVVVLLLLVVDKPSWAAFVLGIGFALKLTPAILLPLILILSDDVRAGVRSLVWFTVPALAPFAAVTAMGGLRGLEYLFSYHLSRPLEIESVFASPLMVAASRGWIPGAVQTQFGSQVLMAPGASIAGTLTGPATVVALCLVYWLIWRRRELLRQTPRILPLAFLAVLLAFLSFGKVLSPQYFIWLLPFVALVTVYRPWPGGLLIAALLLTQVLFPANYWNFAGLAPGPVMIVALRNALLVLATCLVGWSLWRLPARAPSRKR